jgi:CheY-like chemotaxis protein
VYDITDQKRLEEQLRHVQKMEAIGQLTAGIAHNFNNLLSIALPNVELCRAQAPAELHGLLDDVLHATDRAMELVRQLMRFARQENSSVQLATDLRVLAHHTAKICRSTFERRIDIAVLTATDLPPVLARPGEIEQVLLNICLNARDAFADAHTADPRITMRVERGGEAMVRVSIADNGPGMDEAIRARMFEPFFTTKDISKGTGLGLASAYATVVDHRGHIRCDSTKGAGTCFTIELPVAAEPAASKPRVVPVAASRGSEGVLLVDDEALVRRALRAVLEQAGFQVFEAGDGSEGLSLLARHAGSIDVIVLDRSMPRMSGDEFLAQLRRQSCRVPVVLLTGHASGEPDLDGVDAVMMKPPRSMELLRALREVLDARRQ